MTSVLYSFFGEFGAFCSRISNESKRLSNEYDNAKNVPAAVAESKAKKFISEIGEKINALSAMCKDLKNSTMQSGSLKEISDAGRELCEQQQILVNEVIDALEQYGYVQQHSKPDIDLAIVEEQDVDQGNSANEKNAAEMMSIADLGISSAALEILQVAPSSTTPQSIQRPIKRPLEEPKTHEIARTPVKKPRTEAYSIAKVSEEELAEMPKYLTSRFTVDSLNELVENINEKVRVNSLEYIDAEVLSGMGMGSKSKAILLLLSKLDRIHMSTEMGDKVMYKLSS